MVNFSVDDVRLFLHVLSVSVWVGGQIVLAALVPVARQAGPEVPRAMARRFQTVAWPFFVLAVVTGIWNVFEVDMGNRSTSYHITLGIKLLVVAVSGLTAGIHGMTTNRAVRAITGAASLVAGLAATLFGIMLVTG